MEEQKYTPEGLPFIPVETVAYFFAQKYREGLESAKLLHEEEERKFKETNPFLYDLGTFLKPEDLLESEIDGRIVNVLDMSKAFAEGYANGYKEGFKECYMFLRRKAEANKLERELRGE